MMRFQGFNLRVIPPSAHSFCAVHHHPLAWIFNPPQTYVFLTDLTRFGMRVRPLRMDIKKSAARCLISKKCADIFLEMWDISCEILSDPIPSSPSFSSASCEKNLEATTTTSLIRKSSLLSTVSLIMRNAIWRMAMSGHEEETEKILIDEDHDRRYEWEILI